MKTLMLYLVAPPVLAALIQLRVAGERTAIRSVEDLIISTIASDFSSSPTIGYVMVGNTTSTSTNATLPKPFATPEQITERSTNELRSHKRKQRIIQ